VDQPLSNVVSVAKNNQLNDPVAMSRKDVGIKTRLRFSDVALTMTDAPWPPVAFCKLAKVATPVPS
jgi:hypothetical protein